MTSEFCGGDDWEKNLDDDVRDMLGVGADDALLNTCLLELRRSWSRLVYYFFPGFGLKLPNFVIDESRRRWGYWSAATRTMGLSRRLLLCYGWLAVEDILKHELAHQYVDEVLRARELPHGPHFQRTCRAMGICPKASSSPHQLEAAQGPKLAILAKVQKLLKLGGSDNENESRLAVRRAHSLLLKHNLQLLDAGEPDQYAKKALGEIRRRVASEHYAIGNLLSRFFFVEVIWVHGFDPRSGVSGKRLVAIGTQGNLRFAEHVFYFLYQSLDKLWKAHKKKEGIKRNRQRKSFWGGVIHGFIEQLDKQKSENEEQGLVWVGDPGLAEFFQRAYPRTTSRSTRSRLNLDDAYRAGVTQGLKLRLHKPLESESKGGAPAALLPGSQGISR